jgi:Ca2+-binding RTX toxin-like protein
LRHREPTRAANRSTVAGVPTRDTADTSPALAHEKDSMTLHFRNLAGLGAAAALLVGPVVAAPRAGADASRAASVTDGTLTISGGNGADAIALRLATGAPGTLHVDLDDNGVPEFAFDRSTFTRIVVFAGNGDDRIRIDQSNGSFGDEAITVDGGNGNDDFVGGDGNELFIGGRGDDTADGNRGADTAILGAGDDSFRWDAGDGSDVVEGDAGVDTLDFRGAPAAEDMRLVADGSRALFLRDPGNVRMDLDGVERVVTTTLAGVDSFAVGDLATTDVRVVDIDLAAPAGSLDGSDIVTVNGTPGADAIDVRAADGVVVTGLAAAVHVTGSEAIDRLQVNGLDGPDRVDVADGVASLITVAVDLGPGQI